MNAPTARSLSIVLIVSAISLFVSGCYYVPTHRHHDSRSYYDYYGYRHYVPHTDFSITYFSGSYRHHRKHDGYHWRGVPYLHYKAPHVRGDHHRHGGYGRHYGGRHHGEPRRH